MSESIPKVQLDTSEVSPELMAHWIETDEKILATQLAKAEVPTIFKKES